MAIQQIPGKKIFKYDTKKLSKNPNFIQPPVQERKKEVINGNTVENNNKGVYQGDDNIYGEKLMTQMEKMMGKLDNIKVTDGNFKYGEKEKKAVEVDVKRSLFLTKADSVKIDVDEEIKGKVKTKKDKLKALRRRNGR